MARTTKRQMLSNLYDRVKMLSFKNEDILTLTEIEKVKTMDRESDETKEAICWFVESGLFNCSYTKEEETKYKNLLIVSGYINEKCGGD